MVLGFLGVEVRWVERSLRFEGEKETVAFTLGDGIGGEGGDGEDEGFAGGVGVDGVLGLGAKKREMTCCFCFPIFGRSTHPPN